MHGHPPKNLIQRYQAFIELYVAPKFELFSWTEWILYIPQDIPNQVINGKVSRNRGVYVCPSGPV